MPQLEGNNLSTSPEPGKHFNVCEWCKGDSSDDDHEFGCDKEPQPKVETKMIEPGKPLSETGFVEMTESLAAAIVYDYENCKDGSVCIRQRERYLRAKGFLNGLRGQQKTITQQAEIIKSLWRALKSIEDMDEGPCSVIAATELSQHKFPLSGSEEGGEERK